MDYYVIPAKLAVKLSLTGFRTGNQETGYIVNASDLAVIGIEAARAEGARYVSAYEAKRIIGKIRNK